MRISVMTKCKVSRKISTRKNGIYHYLDHTMDAIRDTSDSLVH